MKRVLFSHSYFYKFDKKQWKAAQPYPPYGTIYAAAWLRANGFEVQLFDTNLKNSPGEIEKVVASWSPDFLVLYDDGFNYLTKMCLTNMREAAFEMSKIGKKYACPVIVNSSDSTDHAEEYLREGADFVIHGEGEITLLELLKKLEAGETDFQNLPGISFLENGKFIKNPSRSVLKDLDTLPDPAWDLVDIKSYEKIWLENHGAFTLNIATTRGCPYKCNWCAKPIYGNRYNSRSPERVAGEIEFLVKYFGVRKFWMADDIFGLKPGWVQKFRDEIRARNLDIDYKIQSRVDLLLENDAIDALVESGLRQVWVGAESGSQKILDAMDKGTKVEQIGEATEILKKKGVEVCFFLQFGYLGENRDDIEKTIEMVENLLPHDIGVSVSYPLPGTKFFENVKSMLGEKQNWRDSDDLSMMYPATFSPQFYKKLHRLVHKRFRLRQGLAAFQKIWKTGRLENLRRAAMVLYYLPASILDKWQLQKLEKSNAATR